MGSWKGPGRFGRWKICYKPESGLHWSVRVKSFESRYSKSLSNDEYSSITVEDNEALVRVIIVAHSCVMNSRGRLVAMETAMYHLQGVANSDDSH